MSTVYFIITSCTFNSSSRDIKVFLTRPNQIIHCATLFRTAMNVLDIIFIHNLGS